MRLSTWHRVLPGDHWPLPPVQVMCHYLADNTMVAGPSVSSNISITHHHYTGLHHQLWNSGKELTHQSGLNRSQVWFIRLLWVPPELCVSSELESWKITNVIVHISQCHKQSLFCIIHSLIRFILDLNLSISMTQVIANKPSQFVVRVLLYLLPITAHQYSAV